MRVVAVDWSGRRTGSTRHLWLAEARNGALVRVECGRTRAQLVEHLVALAHDDEPVVVGLDFSFSLPVWFLDEHRLSGGVELWELAREHGEAWLRECPLPFWGKPGHPDQDAHEPLRATEQALSVGGIAPKSTFQIGGAGSVGTGSVRGWPHLLALHDAGYAIWPFDAPARPPVVVEVWPRLCTGAVVKSDPVARVDHLATHLPHVTAPHVTAPRVTAPRVTAHTRDLMAASEDAFDAGFTALTMAAHAHDLANLAPPEHPLARREGWIWAPVRR